MGVADIEINLIQQCKDFGLELISKPNGHYQIKGHLLVNYYPFSKQKTAYVAGTKNGKKFASIKEAVEMALTAPDKVAKNDQDKRGKNNRKKRAALIKKGVTSCFWCNEPLTLDNSTLEHKIPLARGGLDNANNRTLACHDCNNGRGHNMPELDAPF